ncbi:hypothetical protein L1987_45603 [Smallanthus sonchifolius]|uniref:Uncharacterized protein n=1 Tax=Smallanthus sonchifolius TaxID=185202 RepID=A0ACB9FX93_9ASTR|nr:hypothetical protein L1987_45603 [Smallanthus sonchifolius]
MEQLQKALKDQLAPSRSSSGVYYSFSDEDNDDFGVYDGYSDQKSDDFDALHQGQFSFPINDLGFLKSDIKTSKTSTKPRLVRCPRCSCILREPKDVFKYQCGGCGAILQAKIEKDDTIDTTSQMRTKPQFVRCSRCESFLPEPKDGVLVYQCGGCYATLEAKNEKDSMIDTTSQMSTKPRLVRCPRCESVLREPKDVCTYQCGGCGAKLQAKIEKE